MKGISLPGLAGRTILCVAIAFMLLPLSAASGGNLDSPNDPSGGSGMPTLEGIYNQLDTGTAAGTAGTFQEPSSGPTAGTGRTLSDIKGKLPVIDDTNGLAPADAPNGKTFWGLTGGAWGLQTGSNSNMVDTNTGDATAGDIMYGKKAWVDGIEVTGTYRWEPPRAPAAVSGQTATYGTRDDGALQYGVSWPGTRFTDNGDGTVTDNLTGLIWLKNANCGGPKNWAGALTFANSLYDGWTGDGSGGDCGLTDGSSAGDWRLPNKKELWSLIEFSQNHPALPSGHPFSNVQSNYYWSSTAYLDGTTWAWVVTMSSGGLDFYVFGSSLYAWPVRGGRSGRTAVPKTGQTISVVTGDDGDLQKGAAWPTPRFTDNGDGTVADCLTGLIWLKNMSCGGMRPWADALSFANSLYDGWTGDGGGGDCGLADGSSAGDWRLPGVRELESLTSSGNLCPPLPSGHPFSNVEWDIYWSSTTVNGDTSEAWPIYMCFGENYGGLSKLSSYYVWPVRGGQ